MGLRKFFLFITVIIIVIIAYNVLRADAYAARYGTGYFVIITPLLVLSASDAPQITQRDRLQKECAKKTHKL